MTASNLTEPSPCYDQFSTEAGGLHYSWRGWGPGERSTTIGVFDMFTEQWSLKPTTGLTPHGLAGGGCVCMGDCLYTFGGNDGFSWLNDVHKLDINTCQWSKVEPSGSLPMKKFGCGLLHIDDNTLCCFGGFGIGPTQQLGATFTRNRHCSDSVGWTNELHLFNTQNGVWSSPDIRGERPPPCSNFTFTKVDQHRGVLFGGRQPGYDARVDDLYLLNLRRMEFTKMEPAQGEPCPVERSSHAACCLNYSEEHPQLLVSGGRDNDDKTLGDMWILDVDTGKWTEVTPPESHKPRCLHSTTVTSLGPGLVQVLMFGGYHEYPMNVSEDFVPVAKTTLLMFEWTGPSQSVAGPSTGKWALVDVAHNNTRGSSQRLREKVVKIRQATSSVRESSSSHDRVRNLEQQLLRAALDLLQQKEQELTEANCQLETAHLEVTKQRAQLAEQREQILRNELNDQRRELEEVIRKEADMEQNTQLTKQWEQATENWLENLAPPQATKPSLLDNILQQYGLTTADIDKVCSDEHVLEIYPKLEKWEQVALHLGLEPIDIETIENKAPKNVELMRLYALKKWCSAGLLNGTATYRVLIKALLDYGVHDLAVRVCQVLKKAH